MPIASHHSDLTGQTTTYHCYSSLWSRDVGDVLVPIYTTVLAALVQAPNVAVYETGGGGPRCFASPNIIFVDGGLWNRLASRGWG